MKLHIEELIVVEGKNDTNILKKYLDCDTIETNGSALSEDVIARIQLAKERRGVIIFTDPDYPGEKIRKTIDREVPGCKHAFLSKEEAVSIQRKKVGVEHASEKSIVDAILQSRPTTEKGSRETILITRDDLMQFGLLAGEGSRIKREMLAKHLNIGFTNGKQLLKRLNQFQITKEELFTALRLIEGEKD